MKPASGDPRTRVLYDLAREFAAQLELDQLVKRNLSKPAPGHKIYPYFLKGLDITRPNQVWSADITYIRLVGGFVYLVAIIDWYSRYVLAWDVSVTLDSAFCLAALDEAIRLYGRRDIFDSDQGCQFRVSSSRAA